MSRLPKYEVRVRGFAEVADFAIVIWPFGLFDPGESEYALGKLVEPSGLKGILDQGAAITPLRFLSSLEPEGYQFLLKYQSFLSAIPQMACEYDDQKWLSIRIELASLPSNDESPADAPLVPSTPTVPFPTPLDGGRTSPNLPGGEALEGREYRCPDHYLACVLLSTDSQISTSAVLAASSAPNGRVFQTPGSRPLILDAPSEFEKLNPLEVIRPISTSEESTAPKSVTATLHFLEAHPEAISTLASTPLEVSRYKTVLRQWIADGRPNLEPALSPVEGTQP